jgi:transcriptional regulator with XRE-family HTH domain
MTGEYIKSERLKRLWTQEDLATKSTIKTSQISEWETGKRNVSIRNQRKLKIAFESNPI